MNIKKVIHCADIHLPRYQRLEEFSEYLTTFIEDVKRECEGFDPSEVRILIAGDLVHSKNEISNELMSFAATMIRSLESIAPVIVISGNHDYVANNVSRKDTLTSLFETAAFQNSHYLDMELGYVSGCVYDDGITWAVYSIYEGYVRPDIESAKREHPENAVVGLYHGVIVGAMLNNGMTMDSGVSGDVFDGCDAVMAGDIHKGQTVENARNIPIVYAGSLIQQNFGESYKGHGYVVWTFPDIIDSVGGITYEFRTITGRYGLYDITINDISDFDEDKEVFNNK